MLSRKASFIREVGDTTLIRNQGIFANYTCFFSRHEERHQEASLELLTKKHLLDAHHEAVQMFDEQIALNVKLDNSSNFLHEEGSLKENSDIIAKRLKTLHMKQEELTKEIRGLKAAIQDMETEMLRV